MPASARSPQITASYRARLAAIRARVQAAGAQAWPTIDTLDGTRWPDRMAQVLAGAQTEAVRAAAGYLTAYITSELGRRIPTVAVDSRRYVGISRDGRPLTEALQSPVIGVLAALKDGKPPGEALAFGFNRARRMLEIDLMHAARTSLLDAIDADPRTSGWQRATSGTCGACMALSGSSGPHFDVHPGCQCQPQPIVRDVPNHRFPVLSGMEIFNRMTRAEQDDQFGPDKAEALRTGLITLTALVARDHLDSDQRGYLTEAPLDAVTAAT